MLRVLHENPGFFESLVSEFEIPTDQGKRKMDVLLHNGTIVECKSWDDDADTFGDFVQGKGNSYAQFLDYLKVISSMDQLQYWLDGRKLTGNNSTLKRETAVEKFRTLYDGNDNVFNTLVKNPQLRAQLFNGLAAKEARQLYDIYVAQSSAVLFGFIKIK
ncbi:hypothetical protein [Pseudochryseolinea flava]|uniref:Uncharacterized protein n=1 Tax=Pseudochryseolinea flava TaxID=2059302 RepID=A0A364XU05_9BACT|nr:hypothetical protein [Pseudochryseolinea flava]RAV97626.1 hypothetical protein DQQ10_27475 [Pseudochryseolinea flava]